MEILEAEIQSDSYKMQATLKGSKPTSAESHTAIANQKSGKRISRFEGHNEPKVPQLKWFAHDDNIKSLIEMRCTKAVKSTSLELSGSSCASMSRSIACAIDDILNISGNLSMERQVTKELSDRLVFEIEF